MRPHWPPNCHAPNEISLTSHPVLPKLRYSIVDLPFVGGAGHANHRDLTCAARAGAVASFTVSRVMPPPDALAIASTEPAAGSSVLATRRSTRRRRRKAKRPRTGIAARIPRWRDPRAGLAETTSRKRFPDSTQPRRKTRLLRLERPPRRAAPDCAARLP